MPPPGPGYCLSQAPGQLTFETNHALASKTRFPLPTNPCLRMHVTAASIQYFILAVSVGGIVATLIGPAALDPGRNPYRHRRPRLRIEHVRQRHGAGVQRVRVCLVELEVLVNVGERHPLRVPPVRLYEVVPRSLLHLHAGGVAPRKSSVGGFHVRAMKCWVPRLKPSEKPSEIGRAARSWDPQMRCALRTTQAGVVRSPDSPFKS